MLISVIIPTYNGASTIISVLQSLSGQTFTDFEIIIVDGNSKDDTVSCIQAFNDKRITCISEADNGVYDAMNKGILLAKGEWLYFLGDSDTLFAANTFDKVAETLKTTSCTVVYGNVLVNGDTNWSKDGELYNGFFNMEKLLLKNVAHQSVFYHHSVFKKYGLYNIGYKVCADYDLNLRLMANERFKYVNVVIAKFHAGGFSSTVEDTVFNNDFASNLIKYYYRQLHKPCFFQLRRPITTAAIDSLKQMKIAHAIRLLFAASRFYIIHLKNRLQNIRVSIGLLK